jgi:oxygen-independent coproporphyrinogen-3 oxidase
MSATAATAAVRSLYVHIPFCERKCEYCDFTSVTGKRGEHAYVEALGAELRRLGATLPGTELDTIFVGGGTPSFIDPDLLAGVLAEIAADFRIAPDAEITMEANPSSISHARAAVWRAAGFNRISIGVQSLEPATLRFLGRVHDAPRARDAVAEVRAAGFDNINCDLIYAVPGLEDRSWRRTLEEVLSWAPQHLSCYELTFEPQTPLHAAVRRGRVKPVDAGRALAQHWTAVELACSAGLEQYEVSNFAAGDRLCRHNLGYWRCGHYLAAGVGAHGHVPAPLAPAFGAEPAGVAVRYWHGRGIGAYIAALRERRSPLAGLEVIDGATRQVERLMLGLRLSEGVSYAEAGHEADGEPSAPGAAVEELIAEGLLRVRAGRLAATAKGQEVLDRVILRVTAGLGSHAPARDTL